MIPLSGESRTFNISLSDSDSLDIGEVFLVLMSPLSSSLCIVSVVVDIFILFLLILLGGIMSTCYNELFPLYLLSFLIVRIMC